MLTRNVWNLNKKMQKYLSVLRKIKVLKNVVDKISDSDILIDDNSHSIKQEITSLEILFPKIKNGGIYLFEDNQALYRYNYGCGLKRREYILNT